MADREVLCVHSSVTLRLFIAFSNDHMSKHSHVYSILLFYSFVLVVFISVVILFVIIG